MALKITAREWTLAVIFGAIGFIISMRSVLLFMGGLNPVLGFLIYYGIITIFLLVLSKLGLVIFDIKIKSFLQIIGTTLILFSFFILFNWENQYVQYVTTGSLDGASQMFYQSEDGVTWYLWSLLFGVGNLPLLRILTFIITPAFLSALGGLLIGEKVKINPYQ